jgi:hypothetical protein
MTDSEKIDFNGGQIDALLAFTSAVIKTHDNPGALEAEFNASKELQAATTLASTVSDAFVQGQHQISVRLKALFFSAALKRQ